MQKSLAFFRGILAFPFLGLEKLCYLLADLCAATSDWILGVTNDPA